MKKNYIVWYTNEKSNRYSMFGTFGTKRQAKFWVKVMQEKMKCTAYFSVEKIMR